MRFKTLLIHRCDLTITGEKTGEDEYGRDIIGNIEKFDIPCKVDSIRQRASSDSTGTDFIYTNVLILPPDQMVTLETKINNVHDLQGNPVIQGSFVIQDILPIYDRSKLHHFEITLQKG